ncbi:hypothetical protein Esti_004598 [Eimeria stiedai]
MQAQLRPNWLAWLANEALKIGAIKSARGPPTANPCSNERRGLPPLAAAAETAGTQDLLLKGAFTELKGQGFHLVLQTRVQLQPRAAAAAKPAAASAAGQQQEAGCLLSVEYSLPRQLFADPDKTYEFEALEPSGGFYGGPPEGPLSLPTTTTFEPASCEGPPQAGRGAPLCNEGSVLVDVELPAYSPLLKPPPIVRQEVSIHPNLLGGPREVVVELPVHLRYGPPSSTGLLRSAAQPPLVGLSCQGAPQVQQQATPAAAGMEAAAAAGGLEFSVPVGERADWGFAALTSAATAASALVFMGVCLAH